MAAIGTLTQLLDLQLEHVAMDTAAAELSAALSPLTRLTRLSVEFGGPGHNFEGATMDCVPDAVCGLTNLRSLRFGGLEFGFGRGMPPALTRLQRLEDLELRGWAQRDDAADSDAQPHLGQFPALRMAVLRLRVQASC